MAKLVTSDVTNFQNEQTAAGTLNSNFTATELAMENTLSRDGTSPNQMLAQLDMNSFRIINLPAPQASGDPLRQGDVSLTGVIGYTAGTGIAINGLVISTTAVSGDDSLFNIFNHTDTTKIAKFSAASITTATTRTFTLPDANTTLVGTDTTQTLTNKSLTSPTLTGTPIAPTAANRTSTTQVATTAFVTTQTRELLTADRTYAVSKTGNDSNTGLAVTTGIVTFSNGSSAITWTAHGRSVGDNFILSTTSSLPTNFAVGNLYYVKTVTDANTIVIALTSGGTAISAGSAGSGVHTATVYSPFLTVQKSINVIAASIDHNGFSSIVQIGGGTYTENVQFRSYIGRGIQGHTTPILQGAASDTSVVKIAPASGNCFLGVSQNYCEWTISNMEINSAGGIGVLSDAGSWICIGTGCRFGGTATTHIEAENFGIVEITGNYTIFAGAVLHISSVVNGLLFYTGNTVTLTGTPAFSAGFAYVDYEGVIECNGVTFTGSATGTKFIQDHGGRFHLGGSDPNSIFPGNINGNFTAILPIEGGTGNIIYAVGDILSANTTTTLAKIADVAAGSILASGGVNTLPAYTTSPSLTGACTILNATGVPAGGTAGSGYKFSSVSNLGIFFGSGVPTLAAAQGSLYIRTDGSSTSTRMYINTNGSTTWTNVVTAA